MLTIDKINSFEEAIAYIKKNENWIPRADETGTIEYAQYKQNEKQMTDYIKSGKCHCSEVSINYTYDGLEITFLNHKSYEFCQNYTLVTTQKIGFTKEGYLKFVQ